MIINNLKTKLFSRKSDSALSDWDVLANLMESHNNFDFFPVERAPYNSAIICKRLYVLTIAKELRFNSGNSNGKNGTSDKINSILENDIINEHK